MILYHHVIEKTLVFSAMAKYHTKKEINSSNMNQLSIFSSLLLSPMTVFKKSCEANVFGLYKCITEFK